MLPTVPSALPAPLSGETEALIRSSLSPNTKRAYARAWSLWRDYLDSRPPSDAELAGFLTSLHRAGKSPATVSQTLAGIRFGYRLAGKEIAGPVTQRTLAGIRREGRTRGRGQLQGIRWQESDLCVQRLVKRGGVIALRNALLMALMSDGLLRVSELVALRIRDLHPEADGTGRLTIPHSKTDQDGKGAVLFVGKPAMQVFQSYRDLLGSVPPDLPLIQRMRKPGIPTGNPLSDVSVRKIVKAAVKEIEMDADQISSHSLRIGSAQSLVERGAGLVDVQQAGRWTSPDMPARYCRSQQAGRSAIARLRHGE